MTKRRVSLRLAVMTPQEATIEEIFTEPALQAIINDPEINPRHKLFAAGRAYGMSVRDAARGIGIQRQNGYEIEKAFRQSILVSPKMLKLGAKAASTVFQRFLSADDPQHNRLAPQVVALAIRQEDALNPKLIRSQSLNVSLDIAAVDYAAFVDRYRDK